MSREITPKFLTVNGEDKDWSFDAWDLWNEHVSPGFKQGEWCSTANYYTPKPWRNEYDRGSDKEGFTFVVQPGGRVCYWERSR